MATVRAEEDGDGAAAAMGMSYMEGGVEFYSKILGRNVALRQLMGKDGEKLYTVMGNDEVSDGVRWVMRFDVSDGN